MTDPFARIAADDAAADAFARSPHGREIGPARESGVQVVWRDQDGRTADLSEIHRQSTAHYPHDLCPGTAPEFPTDPIYVPVQESGVQVVARMADRVRQIVAARVCGDCGVPTGQPCRLWCPTMAHEDD